MRVGGLGEFEHIRKAMQKEGPRKAAPAKSPEAPESGKAGDEVEISSQGRVMGKLLQISEVRDAKLKEIREKIEAGTLTNPEAVRSGIRELLRNMISGTDSL